MYPNPIIRYEIRIPGGKTVWTHEDERRAHEACAAGNVALGSTREKYRVFAVHENGCTSGPYLQPPVDMDYIGVNLNDALNGQR